jgi:hypothetical protein
MTRKQRNSVALATTILPLAGGGGAAWACTGQRRSRLERDDRNHHRDNDGHNRHRDGHDQYDEPRHDQCRREHGGREADDAPALGPSRQSLRPGVRAPRRTLRAPGQAGEGSRGPSRRAAVPRRRTTLMN